MKKIFATLFFICLFLNVQAQSDETKPYQLLWKIEHESLEKPSYLFGTMHLKHERVFNFSDSVLIVLEKIDAFAAEIDFDDRLKKEISQGYSNLSDTTKFFEDYLSDSDYKKMKKRIKDEVGVDLDKLKTQDPFVLEKLLRGEGDREELRDVFLDAYLYRTSKHLGKEIYGLEEYDRKTRSEDFLTELEKKELIKEFEEQFLSKDSSENQIDIDVELPFKEFESKIEEMISMYERGDLDGIEAIILETEMRKDTVILDYRNKNMAVKIDSILKSGKSLFSAVGVAHLPGETGLINILTDKGYKMTPVKADFTGVAERMEEKFKVANGYFLEKIADGFSIHFPGTPAVTDIRGSNQKMYMYNEVGIDLAYLFMTVNIVDVNTDKATIIDQMFTSMFQRMGVAKGKITEVEYKGLKGKESGFNSNTASGFIRVLIDNNKAFLLMIAGSPVHVKNSQQKTKEFFESLEVYNLEKNIIDWIDLEDEKYSMQFKIPDNYAFFPFTLDNPLNPSGEPYFLQLYSAVDHASSASYIIRANDFPNGYTNQSNTTMFDELEKVITTEYSATITSSEDTLFRGYPARITCFQPGNGGIGELLVVMRGNRSYMLMKQAKEEVLATNHYHTFFDSFHFTAFPSTISDMPTYTTSLTGVEIRIPEKKQTEGNYSYQSEIDTVVFTSAVHQATSVIVSLEETVYTSLYQVENFDSLVFRLKNDIELLGDSVIVYEKRLVNGRPVFSFITEGEDLSFYSYHLIQLSNMNMLHTEILYPKELDSNQVFMDDLSQYLVKPTKEDTVSFFDDKFPLVIQHLVSEDSLLRQSAYEALSYNYVKDSNLPLLYKVIHDSIPNDQASWYDSPKERLIKLLSKVNNDTTVSFLTNLFTQDTSKVIRRAVLNTLVSMDNKDSFNKFFELSGLCQDNYYGSWSLMRPFREDVVLAEEYDSLWQKYFDIELIMFGFIDNTVSWINEDTLDLAWLKTYESLYVKAYQYLIKKEKNKDNYITSSKLSDLAFIFHSLYKPEQYVNVFNEIITLEGYETNGIIGLLKSEKEVGKSLLKKAVENEYSGYEFMLALKKSGLNKVLTNYVDQEELTNSIINYELGYEDDVPDKIKLIEKRRAIYEGQPSFFYISKYKHDWSEEWYVSIVGPQPIDGSLNLEPEIINTYDLGVYNKKSWNKTSSDINDLIKKEFVAYDY